MNVKDKIDKVYYALKMKERETLNKMPDKIAIELQTGFLLGYVDSLVKFREGLLEELDAEDNKEELCKCGGKKEDHPILLGEDDAGKIYCKKFVKHSKRS